MATRITISIKDEDAELLEWMDKQVESLQYRNRSQLVVEAVKELRGEDHRRFDA